MNKIVRIKGITQKGKNRISEHGSTWEIIKESSNGDRLLKATKDDYLKWLKPDFEIIKEE